MSDGTRGQPDDAKPASASAATPGPTDVHIGNRIRLRRTLMGLSQEKLGEALGLTFQQVQKYERGANRVSASRLHDIARVLDVPVGFFYDDMPGTPSRPVMQSASMQPVMGFAETQAQFGAPSPKSMTAGLDPADLALFARKDAVELVRAFYGIPDAAVRRKMLDLVRSMAG